MRHKGWHMHLHHRKAGILRIFLLTSLLVPAGAGFAEDKPPEGAKAEAAGEGEKKSNESAAKKSKIKKYDEVIPPTP